MPLNLPATLQARTKLVPRELLAYPADLDRWLVSAGLARAAPGSTAADLAKARRLREAIFALASGLAAGDSGEAARSVLNQIAAAPAAAPALMADGGVQFDGSVDALLSSIAREAVHLFGGPGMRHVRQCQSPACSIFFVDNSRSGDRRWCSMNACGNKAKVAEFRRRKRADAEVTRDALSGRQGG